MGIPVLVLGESGSGKTASLRNFEPDEIAIFNVASKPLPFRKKLPMVNKARYSTIITGLTAPVRNAYVIDDSQYLMAFENFDRAKEKTWDKYTDMAVNFEFVIRFITEKTPDDVIVYFLHHPELRDDGRIKAKTIGKMLDNQMTLEGRFSIVLLCRVENHEHVFVTESDGLHPAKAPMGMLPSKLENDLKAVDAAIRDYWSLPPLGKRTKQEPKETKEKPNTKEETRK